MADDNSEGRQRNRKVIPYQQAFGVNNTPGVIIDGPDNEENVTHDSEEEGPNPYLRDLRDADLDDPEQSSETDATEDVSKSNETLDSRDDDAEFAQEVAHWGPVIGGEQDAEQEEEADEPKVREGNGWGITGLILSLVSLFIWPAILAPAGMVVGFIAMRREARTMGTWAIVIGAFALLMTLFILPTYFR